MRAYAVGVASAWGFAWPWVRGATGGGATGGTGRFVAGASGVAVSGSDPLMVNVPK